jgi:hypothetical protein
MIRTSTRGDIRLRRSFLPHIWSAQRAKLHARKKTDACQPFLLAPGKHVSALWGRHRMKSEIIALKERKGRRPSTGLFFSIFDELCSFLVSSLCCSEIPQAWRAAQPPRMGTYLSPHFSRPGPRLGLRRHSLGQRAVGRSGVGRRLAFIFWFLADGNCSYLFDFILHARRFGEHAPPLSYWRNWL